MHLLCRNGVSFLPLHIDYGQRNAAREFAALQKGCVSAGFPSPTVMNFQSFGSHIQTGLTDTSLDVFQDAFTPNRNLLFLTLASSLAYQHLVSRIVLGFLSEDTAIFPDQTNEFLQAAERVLLTSLGRPIEIVSPLRGLRKADVVKLAEQFQVTTYYSCHSGTMEPCGRCIACLEYDYER
jgi:7-cyano-7-deazaguanine synthase